MALVRARGLSTPYERWVGEEATVELRLEPTVGPDAVIEFNLLTYLVPREDGVPRERVPRFVRRRFALGLTRDAEPVSRHAGRSAWGVDPYLQLGDAMVPLALPRADGSVLDLAEILGRRKVVVATYLAHW